jgi:hypothetical protein
VTDQTHASGLATATTVTLIAGGALAAAGVVVFVTAPKSNAPGVGIVVSPGAVAFEGRF